MINNDISSRINKNFYYQIVLLVEFNNIKKKIRQMQYYMQSNSYRISMYSKKKKKKSMDRSHA